MSNKKIIWYILQKEIFYWMDKLFLTFVAGVVLIFLLWLELKYDVMDLFWRMLFSVD